MSPETIPAAEEGIAEYTRTAVVAGEQAGSKQKAEVVAAAVVKDEQKVVMPEIVTVQQGLLLLAAVMFAEKGKEFVNAAESMVMESVDDEVESAAVVKNMATVTAAEKAEAVENTAVEMADAVKTGMAVVNKEAETVAAVRMNLGAWHEDFADYNRRSDSAAHIQLGSVECMMSSATDNAYHS